MSTPLFQKDKTNKLSSTKVGGRMTAAYWENIFTAKERGKHVVWYNGAAMNPLFQAAGLEWCHGEASPLGWPPSISRNPPRPPGRVRIHRRIVFLCPDPPGMRRADPAESRRE